MSDIIPSLPVSVPVELEQGLTLLLELALVASLFGVFLLVLEWHERRKQGREQERLARRRRRRAWHWPWPRR